MVLTCSPQQDAGSFRFPSPSHLHHLDATSTLIQLRRSLSRSPSKSPALRSVANKHVILPMQPLCSSPLSPQQDTDKLQVPSTRSAHGATRIFSPAASPLGTDPPSSTRGSKPVLRRFSPLRPNSRSLATSRPTFKPRRALCESSDNGNSSPVFRFHVRNEEESSLDKAEQPQSVVQAPKAKFTGFVPSSNTEGPTNKFEMAKPPQSSFNFRSDKHGNLFSGEPFKSSPLKRADAPTMSDPSGDTSPSAKRRSLHGASDFNVFDEIGHVDMPMSSRVSPEPSFPPSKINVNQPLSSSKRSDSLRRSTIQQRHERPTLNRSRANNGLTHEFNSPLPVIGSNRSVDSSRSPLPTRRNLFAAERSSESTTSGLNSQTAVEPPRTSSRHPLSRTMTQSSSGTDNAQDSPTHVPARVPNRRLPSAFGRSLPIGFERRAHVMAESSAAASEDVPGETPANYKSAKPLQAAFRSTGLISKRTKDVHNVGSGIPAVAMPDTPCKRPMPPNPMAPNATPAPPPRHTQLRRNVHAFGAPSTPFNPGSSRPPPGANGLGRGIFGSTIKPLNRRGSFLNAESDGFAPERSTSQSTELPATPSKTNDNATGYTTHAPKFEPRASEVSMATCDPDTAAVSPRPIAHCKFFLNCPDGDVKDVGEDCIMDESPSAQRRYASLGAISSFAAHRRPSILEDRTCSYARKAKTLPHIRTGNLQAKTSPLSPASPFYDPVERRPPHTPKDSPDAVAPPDPSGLSISARVGQTFNPRQSTFTKSLGPGGLPPATPTTNRDSFHFQSEHFTRSAAHILAEAQLDLSLTTRFDEIQFLGFGEFSDVLKVFKNEALSFAEEENPYQASLGDGMKPLRLTSDARRVYAVKMSRNRYLGQKDRAHKLKEAEVMSALGKSEHTIQMFDYWEHNSRLYLQTEYCEEGALDKFIVEAGRGLRMDDFRIWKVLVELSKGLKHIHDNGFMHLDLKPANVFVSFDGTLKIADFGLAASWPATPGVEAEGDREYIGPEILTGNVDKPSDIFSLGLIIFEIAANVCLPDNGESWQRLRQGDISDVPSLTSTIDAPILRSANGIPLCQDDVSQSSELAQSWFADAGSNNQAFSRLSTPPSFMADPEHPQSLEHVVTWMINPTPQLRPTVDELLQSYGCAWVEDRRRASATIFEGEWGPAFEDSHLDAEMMDV